MKKGSNSSLGLVLSCLAFCCMLFAGAISAQQSPQQINTHNGMYGGKGLGKYSVKMMHNAFSILHSVPSLSGVKFAGRTTNARFAVPGFRPGL